MAGKKQELSIEINGSVNSSFKNAMNIAGKGIKSLGKSAAGIAGNSFKNAMSIAGRGIKGMTKLVASATKASAMAVGGIATAAVNTGKEFEKSMSQVSATMLIDKNTQEGAKQYEILENAARECGRTTAFSASEAAEGLNYLALAGYDAEKAATALPTVLKLAGAGGMELASASDMVTDSMSALGQEATQENLDKFADQLAKTASKANTSVEQLGEAIITVGGTAANLAGGTTELNTSLGILADSGIKAAEGGTHLRNMIMVLQNPRNKDAAKLFEDMGLSAYDAQGNMRSLGDIFGDLNNQMQGLSAEDVNKKLATIFKQTDLASARAMLAATADSMTSLGTAVDASLAESGTSMQNLGINLDELAKNFDKTMSQEEYASKLTEQFGISGEQAGVIYTGLQSVLNGTGNRFAELSKEIENSSGACQEMYDIQLDNLDGDIAKLKSGLSDLGISIYDDMNKPLRQTTQFATDMISELSSAYGKGGLEGMITAVGGCLGEAVNMIAEKAPNFVNLAIKLVESFVEGMAGNSESVANAASEILTTFVDGMTTLIPQVILAGIDLVTQFAQSITTKIPEIVQKGAESTARFAEGIAQRMPEVAATAIGLAQTYVTSLVQNAPMLVQSGIQLISSLGSGITSMLPQLVPLAFQAIITLASGLIAMLPQIVQTGIQLLGGLVQGIVDNLPMLLQAAVQLVVQLVQGITEMLPMIIQGGIQMILGLVQGIYENLPMIIQSAIQIIFALATGLIQAIPQLIAAIPQLVGGIIETILSTDWIEVGGAIISGIVDGVFSMAEEFGNSVKNTVLGFFGFGDDEEEEEAESSGASTASSYASGITTNSYLATNAATSMNSNAFGSMDFSNATTAGTNGANAYATGIASSSLMATSAANTMGNTAFGAMDVTSATTAGTNGANAYANGLTSGMSQVQITAPTMDMSQFTTSFSTAGTNGANAMSSGMTAGASNVASAATTIANSTTTALDSGWNTAKTNATSAMDSIANIAKSKAQAAASAIKAAFEGMSITIPRPKIPVISTSYKTETFGEGGDVKIPQFDVNWNAAGGILDKATILNTTQGLQGVGEAGPEAILPLDTLWEKMRDIVQQESGQGVIGRTVQRMNGITAEDQTAGTTTGTTSNAGASVVYSPTYNLYGNTTKDDIREADKLSQAEFNKMMEKWQRQKQRVCF